MGAGLLTVDDTGKVIPGKHYVSHFVVRFPPWPGYAFMNKLIFPGIMKSGALVGAVVDSCGFIDPDALVKADAAGALPFKVPADMKSGRGRPFCVIVEWHADSFGGGPDQAGPPIELIIKALVVLITAGLGYLTVRSFTSSAKEIGNAGAKTIFSPGFIIAGLVIFAVIAARRS